MSGLWTGVITHLWQTTLVLAMIAVLAALLRRAPARYLEGLWTAALLKLLLPLPLLVALWPALQRLGVSAGQQQTIGPAVQRLSQIAYPEMLWVELSTSSSSWFAPTYGAVATLLWALGAVALLALWWRHAGAGVPQGEEPWHASDEIVERVSRAARAANVPLGRIRITDAAIVPCIGNLRRPMVVLPRSVVLSLRDDELHAVLLHEDAHRRRGDLWRGALQRLTTCLFFFYPPAWWLARRLRAAAEMACDEAVLATGIDARTYARALARTVVLDLDSMPAPALHSGRSDLSARLQRIQTPERYAAMKRHRIVVVAAVAAAVGLSFVPVADSAGVQYVASISDSSLLEGSQLAGEWLPAERLSGLDGLESLVEFHFVDAPLAQVFQEVGASAGFEVYFTSTEDFTRRISTAVSGSTLRAALALLAADANIEYRVADARTLIVRVRHETPVPADEAVAIVARTPRADVPAPTAPETQRKVIRRAGAPVAAPTPDAVPAADSGPLRVGGDISEPERIRYVAPEYPELARTARMEGFVILQAVIDREGNVKDVDVLRGLGLGLDEAATDAVRQWKYTPTVYNGEPVEVSLIVNVVFQLIQ